MKKRLFFLFLAGSLISSHACLSSGNIEEEGPYGHYYKPSLTSAVINIFWGGACCLAAEVAHNDYNKNFGIPVQVGVEVGLALGYKMVIDDGAELLHWG